MTYRQVAKDHTCTMCPAPAPNGSRCHDCNKKYMAEYRKKNIEKIRAGQRDHYQRNSEIVKKKVKRYAIENAAKVKESSARYYRENQTIRYQKILDWQKANPEKTKQIQRTNCLNRVARSKAAEGRHTAADIQRIGEEQEWICKACRCDVRQKYHVDHIVPLSRGGSNWPSNLQVLCPPCNVRKSAKTMDEFIRIFEC